MSTAESEALAIRALGAMVGDVERLGAFLVATGLDPASIRQAAKSPDFLVALLDYLASDESLLVAVAGEIGVTPERIMAARAALSPEPDEGP